MPDENITRFEALRKAYKDANKARKEAARGSKAVKGIGGKRSRLEALASIPGTRAANAELDALHGQIRALESLLSFARSVVDGARAAPAKSNGKRSKKAVKLAG
jgi:hypothetical protein